MRSFHQHKQKETHNFIQLLVINLFLVQQEEMGNEPATGTVYIGGIVS